MLSSQLNPTFHGFLRDILLSRHCLDCVVRAMATVTLGMKQDHMIALIVTKMHREARRRCARARVCGVFSNL